MPKSFLIAVIIFLLCYLWFRNFELRNIFLPTKKISQTPDIFGLDYQDIFFYTKDNIELNGWFLSADKNKHSLYTVLFSHGNAGNISYRIEKLVVLLQLGLNIFIYDYRGYGKSSGQPSEEGLYRDAEAAYEFLVNKMKIGPDRIIAYGESLGSVSAAFLAKNFKLKAVILEGAFTNSKEIAKEIFPFLPGFFIRTKLDNLSNLSDCPTPKLFLHSKDDEIVPFKLAKRLFDNSAEPKYFSILTGQHNNCFLDNYEHIKKVIADFLGRI